MLKDYLKDNDVFNAIESIKTYPFLEGGVDSDGAQELENLLHLEHGRKPLFDVVEDFTVVEIAQMIVKKYDERWTRLIQREIELDNVNNRHEISETVDRTEEKLSDSSRKDKTASFDSEVLVDESGQSTDGSEDTTGNTTRTYTDEHIDAIRSFNMLNVSARDTIMNQVVTDVADFLTLSIY